MRYILINELYTMGGTEVQGKREKKLMESHGHEVLYITFDNAIPNGQDPEDRFHFNFNVDYSPVGTRVYRIWTDSKLVKEVRKVIESFAPDFIHINNALQHALVIYQAINGYPAFQTLRDYTAVCPTGLCVDCSWNICKGIKEGKCLHKCMPENKKGMFVYWYLIQKRIMKYRKKYISKFVCPSQTLTDYCNEHGLNTTCINNPFDFSIIENFSKILSETKTKRYLYYGIVAKHKGVLELLEAFNTFSVNKDVELLIAGKCLDNVQLELDKYTSNPKVKYLGVLEYSDIIELLKGIDIIVVPSLWMENYPNTVLEGLCCECVVIASTRGGMKEQIRNEDLIFDVMNNADIIDKLEFTYNLSKEDFNCITKTNKEYVLVNNSLEKYYERFVDFVNQL